MGITFCPFIFHFANKVCYLLLISVLQQNWIEFVSLFFLCLFQVFPVFFWMNWDFQGISRKVEMVSLHMEIQGSVRGFFNHHQSFGISAFRKRMKHHLHTSVHFKSYPKNDCEVDFSTVTGGATSRVTDAATEEKALLLRRSELIVSQEM